MQEGYTTTELLWVGGIAAVIIVVDIFTWWFLSVKTHDIRVLSEVQQIRSGLEVYSAINTQFPVAENVTPLARLEENTQKLCMEGFRRYAQNCEKTILPFVPNFYADDEEGYMYQSADGSDYRIEFITRSNFSAIDLPQGVHCATGAGITHQSCF